MRTIVIYSVRCDNSVQQCSPLLKKQENCAPLTSCITEINYTQVEYDEDIDIVDSLCII